MSKRPLVIFGIFAAICLVALPAWALTKKGGSDASSASAVPASNQQGLELFQINCGACHTLAAAGTDGLVGPDLDERFGTGAKSQLEKSTYATVLTTIQNGLSGRMPADIVKGDQAKEIAAFVANNVAYIGP
ncbi:MAG TPA: cytochrome c [Solirubrobacterales bacterium]|jgi:mono/diheme cytochrome c family protein